MTRVRFVSDVHLTPEDPSRAERFLRLLRDTPVSLGRLLILGDLFDWWTGASQALSAADAEVLARLSALSRDGLSIGFVRGNRDFLVGSELAGRTGMAIHGDEVEASVGTRRVLATHGDLLCTRDTHYQAYRRLARSPLVRWAFAALPGGVRERVARRWERKSGEMVAAKPAEVRRIDDEAVRRVLARGFDAVVCGHAHRRERRELPGGTLFVLGSWDEGGSWLDLDEEGFRFGELV